MLRAVLIDDDESNLSSLSEKLKHCPQVHIISRCDNAQEGMQVIENQKPDVVFLDIEMPVMNGFVMLQQLDYKDFALIFVTAYDHYAIKAIRYSALDYLVKPVEIEELKVAVEKAEVSRSNRSSHLQLDLLLGVLDNCVGLIFRFRPEFLSQAFSVGTSFYQDRVCFDASLFDDLCRFLLQPREFLFCSFRVVE